MSASVKTSVMQSYVYRLILIIYQPHRPTASLKRSFTSGSYQVLSGAKPHHPGKHPRPGKPTRRKPGRPSTFITIGGDPVTDAIEACSDPWTCESVNSVLPPCTKSNPNFNYCGSNLIGQHPDAGANQSNWPTPIPQNFMGHLCWPFTLCGGLGGEFCCIECEMRYCCAFGPIQTLPGPRRPPSSRPPSSRPPIVPPFLSIPPGRPVPVPPGHSPVWS